MSSDLFTENRDLIIPLLSLPYIFHMNIVKRKQAVFINLQHEAAYKLHWYV